MCAPEFRIHGLNIKEAGIYTIADLADRIIDDAAYKVKWIARCEAIGVGEKKNSTTE